MAKTKPRKNKTKTDGKSPTELNQPEAENSSQTSEGSDLETQDENFPEKVIEDTSETGKIEALETQLAELNDRYLRAVAETENVRRRSQRDKEDATKYGIKSFAEIILIVADNLDRGLKSVEPEDRKNSTELENIVTGIEMIQRDLLGSLEQFGIRQIEAMGQKFDPLVHEAMFEIENPELSAGTIVQVLEVGYLLHDRTLRAAKVGITKGGPKLEDMSTDPNTLKQSSSVQKNTADKSAYEEKKLESGYQIDEKL